MGILATAVLGLVSVFSIAQRTTGETKARHAATLAGASQLDEIVTFANLEGLTATDTNYNGTGFDIMADAAQIGFVFATTDTTTTYLKPANGDLFPVSRAGATTAIKAQAGYIEVENPVAGRSNIALVTVTVAWKTLGGGDAKINFSQLVDSP